MNIEHDSRTRSKLHLPLGIPRYEISRWLVFFPLIFRTSLFANAFGLSPWQPSQKLAMIPKNSVSLPPPVAFWNDTAASSWNILDTVDL